MLDQRQAKESTAVTIDLPVLPPLDARIPKWSLEKLELRKCPLCRSSNPPSLVRPDRLLVAFCETCQLWYISTLPPLEEIQQLYQGYWFSFRPKDLSQSYANVLMSDERSLKDDMKVGQLNHLSALSGGLEGMRLLEIGCGCGEFLVAARRRGATVFGNDISHEACSFVRERLGIPVCEGQLSDAAFTAEFGHMDIVVMGDLIEHPVEPLATFESALAVLKPGGLLFIHTPNGGAACDDVQDASQWVGLRVDLEHLQYFSSATVSMLADTYDCRIEHLEILGFPKLEGIDEPPAKPADTTVSLKDALKSQLRKSALSVKLRRAVRAFRDVSEASLPDPRCGTYHLDAVLRKTEAH